jgi:hypothetical protein
VVAQFAYRVEVVSRGVPAVGLQVAVGHLLLGHAQHGPQVLVLGILTLGLRFLGFRIPDRLGFLDELDGDGQGQLAGLIKQAHEVKALDKAALAVVPMGTNQRARVRVRLFHQRIIDDEHGKLVGPALLLGPANQRLGLGPDLLRVQVRAAEPAGDLIVAHRPAHQPRQARGRGLAGRAKQIIRVQVQRASHLQTMLVKLQFSA